MADVRDKTIAAILDAPPTRLGDLTAAGGARLLAGALLDAIPADVLVDLAIERGALMPVETDGNVYEAAPSYLGLPTETPLYRRADRGTDG